MESNHNNESYKEVYLSIKIPANVNKMISKSASRAGRTKTQEARLRLHDHLERYYCISELHKAEEK